MPTINQLNSLSANSSLEPSDQIPVYSSDASYPEKVSVSKLQDYILNSIGIPQQAQTIYASPIATGFNIPLQPTVSYNDVFLVCTPSNSFATGTFTFPTFPVDKQSAYIFCSQGLTSVSFVSGNNSVGVPISVFGAPVKIVGGCFFGFRYDQITNSWYRFTDANSDPVTTRTLWSTNISNTNINPSSTLNVLTLIPNASKDTTVSDTGVDALNIVSNGILVPWRGRQWSHLIRLDYSMSVGVDQKYSVQIRRLSDNSIVANFLGSRSPEIALNSALLDTFTASATDPFVTSGFGVFIQNPSASVTLTLSTSLTLLVSSTLR